MSTADALRVVLGSQTNDKSVHAQALFKIIQNASTPDERVELMTVAFVERDTVPKNPKVLPNKGIPDEVWDNLVKTHSGVVSGHLKMAFFKTHTAREFVAETLRLMEFFSEENEKTFVLASALYSPYIPYHELPGNPVHMTDLEFQHKCQADPKHVELIDYILSLPFDERTESASMLLQVIDDIPDHDLRVALLARALGRLERNTMQRVVKQLAKSDE